MNKVMNKIETKYYSIVKNKISFYSKIIVTLEYLDIFEINIQIFNFNFSVNWKYIYIYISVMCYENALFKKLQIKYKLNDAVYYIVYGYRMHSLYVEKMTNFKLYGSSR